jgi:hypothetical protein
MLIRASWAYDFLPRGFDPYTLLERSLFLREQLLGATDPSVADVLERLNYRRDPADMQRAISILEIENGPDSTRLITPLMALVSHFLAIGDREAVRRYQTRIVHLLKSDPSVMNEHEHLAVNALHWSIDLGRSDDAEYFYNRCVDLGLESEIVADSRHERVLLMAERLAETWGRQFTERALDSLVHVFELLAKKSLAAHPDLTHSWRSDAESLTLSIPKQCREGFAVTARATARGIIVESDIGGHTRREYFDVIVAGEDTEEIARGAFSHLRALLCSDMRVRELRAGGKPYRWIIESYDGATWQTNSFETSIFWNYFGRRSEAVFQNDVLPSVRLGRH